jgi:hypothetical protein
LPNCRHAAGGSVTPRGAVLPIWHFAQTANLAASALNPRGLHIPFVRRNAGSNGFGQIGEELTNPKNQIPRVLEFWCLVFSVWYLDFLFRVFRVFRG